MLPILLYLREGTVALSDNNIMDVMHSFCGLKAVCTDSMSIPDIQDRLKGFTTARVEERPIFLCVRPILSILKITYNNSNVT